MVSKQSLVVAVLIPVEGFDLQAAAFRVTAHDPGDRLVHGAGGRCGVLRQEDDLVPQVDPALHTGQLDDKQRGHRLDWSHTLPATQNPSFSRSFEFIRPKQPKFTTGASHRL